jgi:hypothetical protein
MIGRGKHLHLDCPSGIAGDMLLGALFDLGVPVDMVRQVLGTLPLGAFRLGVERTLRGGLSGIDVKLHVEQGCDPGQNQVHAHDHARDHDHGPARDHDHGPARDHDHGPAHDHDHGSAHDHDHGSAQPAPTGDVRHAGWHERGHAHRHFRDIRALLDGLPAEVRRIARDVFERIAEAEAKLHGTSVDDVAFHEVGAVDSIVDVVGAAAAIAYLAPSSISCSPLALGHGTVRSAHGLLPVPAPATLSILAAAKVPTVDGGAAFELTTPTGAALVAQLVTQFGPMPPGRPVATGWGAGDRELADRPNLVRAVLVELELKAAAGFAGAPGAPDDEVIELFANVDDMNPQLCDHVLERLLGAGALDAWWQPVIMKKGRPALVLGVLSPPALQDALTKEMVSETTTIGVRSRRLGRRVLQRRLETVSTPYGPVQVKLASLDGQVVNAAPEIDDCRRLASERGVALKLVVAAAAASAQSLLG